MDCPQHMAGQQSGTPQQAWQVKRPHGTVRYSPSVAPGLVGAWQEQPVEQFPAPYFSHVCPDADHFQTQPPAHGAAVVVVVVLLLDDDEVLDVDDVDDVDDEVLELDDVDDVLVVEDVDVVGND